MLVQDFLERSADWSSAKVALVHEGQRLTYGEIELQSNRLANAMKARGLGRGERVVLWLPNSVELVVGIFATLKAGGVFVVANYSTKYQKLAYIVRNCQASALVATTRKAHLALRLGEEVPSLRAMVLTGAKEPVMADPRVLSFEAIQKELPARRPPCVNIDLDLACLIYTSGTTGAPKGVMSDHSNVVFAASSIIQYLQNVPDDVVINALPLSFDYGLYQLLMVFKFGGTLVLEKGFSYPGTILRRMEQERVTGFPGVPTVFAIFLQMDLSAYDLCLRYLTNTAASLPPSHIAHLRALFPQARLYSMYGLTETKRTLYLPPEQLDAHPTSVGIAIPGTEVWIEGETGERLGPGQVGELVVRGRHVMRGYWQDPEATKARFRPGPLHGECVCYTGDLFRVDEEGYYYFVSRSDDIIKSRGEKVAPKEVENVIYGLPGVVEVAVVGVPDAIQGEAIKAFIVGRNSELTEPEILAHCRAYLEDFMVPKYVELCQKLPKTTSGKITKVGLA
ncbi:MAG: AMP-binding protein [Anaerolineae bacterium]|nr:AMP-binding protein [Anaerolineae bacterium]